MKLSINSDFTSLPRAGSVLLAHVAGSRVASDTITLVHDERHVRRKVLTTASGAKVFVDLAAPVHLSDGDRLILDDGGEIAVTAAPEDLLEVVARDTVHLTELAWHIGNRHLAAQIEAGRLLILRDHVIRDMLAGLGATVRDVVDLDLDGSVAQVSDQAENLDLSGIEVSGRRKFVIGHDLMPPPARIRVANRNGRDGSRRG